MRLKTEKLKPVLAMVQKVAHAQEEMMTRGLHSLGQGIFKKIGYKWHLRHRGEIKLGYLQKVFRKRSDHDAYPKRFILVPGFGDTPLAWFPVIMILQPFLKAHYDEVILFDFPGFGGFLSLEKSFPSIDLMTSTFHDILDSLSPHTILGHSLGAWMSADYAAHCGVKKRPLSNSRNYSGPKSLILTNPSGIFPSEATKRTMAELFLEVVKEGFSNLRPKLFSKEPFWFRFVVPYFIRFMSREDTVSFMKTITDDHTIEKIAHQIQSEVWLVWGENDTLIPRSYADAWLGHLDPAQKEKHHLVLLKGGGHSLHLEQPAAIAAVIGQIISGRAPHWAGKRWWEVVV